MFWRKPLWFVSLFFIILLLPAPMYVKAEQESQTLELQIHYLRYKEDYEDWSLWLWTDDKDGKEYAFSNQNDTAYGVETTVIVPHVSDDTSIGILVKYGDWEQKDIEQDRYLDLTKAENRVLQIYLLQGDEHIYYSREDIRTGSRMMNAFYDDINQISFSLYIPGVTQEQTKDMTLNLCIPEENYQEELSDVTIQLEGNLVRGTGKTNKQAELSKASFLSLEGMENCPVAAGKIFDTAYFADNYTYEGDDLGAVYDKEGTAFRVWAPTSSAVVLNLYETGDGDDFRKSYEMEPSTKGTWKLYLPGDYNGIYYTYSVTVNGETRETIDPYAKACGVNGYRGMVIDLSETNPKGFLEERKPELTSFNDIILYEMSVRDYTIDESSGVEQRGKYLGLTEKGTVNEMGEPTGLDYLGKLGVTHVHLLPCQDFEGVDEENPTESYNWGYMPQNYYIPEGSYSTNPYQGEVRIEEYKQMVYGLHKEGIRVVMDVVYNHTGQDASFDKIVPGYYYRKMEDGTYSNGSGCGNELASERPMVRKLILDSVVYWAKEYHIDGFRFDLMGLLDVETMNLVREQLDEVDDSIFLYGEGWNAGETVCTLEMAESENASDLNGIAVFSNVFRRGIQSYVSGQFQEEVSKNSVLFGVVAATPQEITKQSMGSWTKEPAQCINYNSCHDGFTIWDLIRQNCLEENETVWLKRNKLAAAVVMTCQGVPFMHSGEEICRSKVSEQDPDRIYSNSYNSGDYVNSMKWNTLGEQRELVSYYQGLMAFRKAHPALRYATTKQITKYMHFINVPDSNVIAYSVTEPENFFLRNEICVIYNPNQEAVTVQLKRANWEVYITGQQAGTEVLSEFSGSEYVVPGIESAVLMCTYVKPEIIWGSIAIGGILFVGIIVGILARRRRNEHRSNH